MREESLEPFKEHCYSFGVGGGMTFFLFGVGRLDAVGVLSVEFLGFEKSISMI